MKTIVLNFEGVDSMWDLHEQLKKAFSLPDYYGRNMDALWDCLHCGFDSPTLLVLKNLDKLPKAMKESTERMLEVFRDLEQEDAEVTLKIEN